MKVSEENQHYMETKTHTPDDAAITNLRHSWALGVTILEWLSYDLVFDGTGTPATQLEHFVNSPKFVEDDTITAIVRDCIVCNTE